MSYMIIVSSQVNAVADKLDIIHSKLLRRMENVEQSTVAIREEIKHLKERVTKSQHQEREKYSKFAQEKGRNTVVMRHTLFSDDNIEAISSVFNQCVSSQSVCCSKYIQGLSVDMQEWVD